MRDDEKEKIWRAEMLERYPMDSNAMVADLPAELRTLLAAYVTETTLSEELATVVDAVAARHPQYLRVKELFETVEAWKRIGQAIYEQWRTGRVETVYDFACGHGLLGLLFAYRFRKVAVVCVDLERRPAFDHYLAVAREHGVEFPNLTYVEGDFTSVDLGPRSYVVCIHACNEGTRDALDRARDAGAGFAAMPCCIRDGIYLRTINHADDQTRYAASVGAIAGRYGAYKITAIDGRITNRNLIVLGAPTGGPSDA